jgi:DNA-directed RNA polymerase subunit RPC12/RpoP
MHRVERERTVYTYMCAKCGKVFESTYKAAPRQNMYCDEHRIWRDRAGNGMNAQTREPAPEAAANPGLSEAHDQQNAE